MKQKPKIKFANKDRSKFFGILKANVDAYFTENNISKHANGSMIFKTVVMIFLYIAPLASLMFFHQETWQIMIGFSIVGLGMAGIGMNVMHDANHNAYSANPMVNKLVGYSLNMVGGTVFNWKLQHNILHHTYTNVYQMDDDIDDKISYIGVVT